MSEHFHKEKALLIFIMVLILGISGMFLYTAVLLWSDGAWLSIFILFALSAFGYWFTKLAKNLAELNAMTKSSKEASTAAAAIVEAAEKPAPSIPWKPRKPLSQEKINWLLSYQFPEDAISFFASSHSPYHFTFNQAGTLVPGRLCRLGEIQASKAKLYTWEYRQNEHGQACQADPNLGSNGSYSIPVLELARELEGYDPEGVFVWYPDLKRFGACDSDHGVHSIFLHKGFMDLYRRLDDLLEYAMDPWEDEKIQDIYEVCNPWELWDYTDQ